MTSPFEAFFLESGPNPDRRRFCIFHPPQKRCIAAAVYVHPFGDEMNKSRRMAALQARALAAHGIGILLLDLGGCGDSAGELADATWTDWIDDILRGVDWLRVKLPGVTLWLWGLRSGCLLASAAAARLDAPSHLLLWQAPASGKSVLAQFLRLKMAAQLAEGGAKGVTEQLRADLAAGRSVLVAGYELPAAVALDLERAVINSPHEQQQILWLEVSTRSPAELLPASQATIDRWDAGDQIQAQAVAGPAFWQTTEIEDAPELLLATTQMMALAVEQL